MHARSCSSFCSCCSVLLFGFLCSTACSSFMKRFAGGEGTFGQQQWGPRQQLGGKALLQQQVALPATAAAAAAVMQQVALLRS